MSSKSINNSIGEKPCIAIAIKKIITIIIIRERAIIQIDFFIFLFLEIY